MKRTAKTHWWVVFGILLIAASSALADFTVFPVVENMSADHKDFDDGIVVFRNYPTGSGVWYHNLSTKETVRISGAGDDPNTNNNKVVWEEGGRVYIYYLSDRSTFYIDSGEMPAISGNTIVFNGSGRNDIYGYDLITRSTFVIPTSSGIKHSADIAGNIVAWRGSDDIWSYNLQTQESLPICTAPGIQSQPSVSGNRIVWFDERNGGWDVYGYDLNTKTEFVVSNLVGSLQDQADIYGDIVVWGDNRNGDFDIYGLDLTTGQEFPVFVGPGPQREPEIWGNIVVWTDEYRSGIYGAIIPEPAALVSFSLFVLGTALAFRQRKK